MALTPVAIHEAISFVKTVFDGVPTPVDHTFVPTAVFSQPEIGTVGMTEDSALAHGYAIDVYKSSFRPLKNTLSGPRRARAVQADRGFERQSRAWLPYLRTRSSRDRSDGGRRDEDGRDESRFRLPRSRFIPSAAEELVTMRTRSLFEGRLKTMDCPAFPSRS